MYRRSLIVESPWVAGVLLALLVCGVGSRPGAAQVLYGSVVGTVTDQSDSAVPSARITLTNKETGLAREAATDDGGRYSFVNVLPGRYDIKVIGKGFKPYAVNDFDVRDRKSVV